MEPTSRRQFLKRSSAVAAAAGVAAAVPTAAAKAVGTHAEQTLPDDDTVDVPVVAHVRDARKGLVSLYTADKEIVVKNKRLAAALYHATR